MKNRWKTMMALTLCAGVANAAFVTIGGAGNSNDTANACGGVSYAYKISSTEVTIQQMADSGAGSGNEGYWNEDGRTVGTAAPAVYVSLYEAMKYCNYLTSGNVNDGVYTFSGGVYQSTLSRASIMSGSLDAVATDASKIYALPTEDEWYKAAYWKGGNDYSLYANGSDTVPTHGTTNGWNYYSGGYVNDSPNYTWEVGSGGEEQNGTYDMMGNVYEWMEDSSGVSRGGRYNGTEGYLRSSSRGLGTPSSEYHTIGFRPAELVPEPATAGMLAISGLLIAAYRRFFGRV